MISAQDIVDAIAPLSDEARSLVLDFARQLRNRDALTMPTGANLDGVAFDRWLAAVDSHAIEVLAEQRRRVEAAGLPVVGAVPESQWPVDMAKTSKTSVAT